MLKKLKIFLSAFAFSLLLASAALAVTASYTVKPGDTLCGIGKQFNVPCNVMIDNFPPGLDPNLIHPGDGLEFEVREMGSELLGGLVSKPYTFSPNTVISSAQINANYDTLYTLVNGNISNANINASAAISSTKINGTAIVSTGATNQSIFSTTTIYGGLIVSSTTNYFRVPVMTTAERNALTNLEGGIIIYSSSDGQFYVREGGSWAAISPAAETALANSTTKGIVELATNAELEAGTANGGTGAALVLTPGLWLEYADTHFSNNLPVGENVTAYNVLYMSSTGSYYIAHANVQAEVDRVAGVVFETITATNYPRVYFPGSIIYSTSGMTTGSPVYLSDTGTASTTAGTIRKVLGIALGTNVWQFNPTVDTPSAVPTANTIPIASASGTLDLWLGMIRGNGSDGTVTISASTTLTRDMFYNNLTINSGVVVSSSYKIHVLGTLTNAGTIQRNGFNGTAGTNGTTGVDAACDIGTGGAGAAGIADGSLAGSKAGQAGGNGGDGGGGAGVAGTAGTAFNNTISGSGAASGAGGAGTGGAGGSAGSAGAVGATTSSVNSPTSTFIAVAQFDFNGILAGWSGSGGGGGGGGGGTGIGGQNFGCGGGGGGSASSGGTIWISANTIVNSGTISSNGGTGGNGGAGGVGTNATGGKGGGGAGGHGGNIFLFYHTLTNTGSITATAGNGGALAGTGNGGAAGTNGTAGKIWHFQF